MSSNPAILNIELWGSYYSTCVQRILFTIEELGGAQMPYRFNTVDLFKGEHKSPAHLARQPFGKVPAAEIDGQPFYESRAISRIIAEYSSHSNLMPRDLKHKAVFEQWASLEQDTYNGPMSGIVAERMFKKAFGGGEPDEDKVKKLHADSQNAWRILDQQLASRDYITGQFSLIDIFFAPYFQIFSTLPEGKEVLAQYPNIARWWERLSGRPAWQKVFKQGQEAMNASMSAAKGGQ